MPPPSRPRARLRALGRLLKTALFVVFVLALAAMPLPFLSVLVLARRPERETDAVVELMPRLRIRKDKS